MRTKPFINTTHVYLAHKGSIIIIVFRRKSNIAAHNIIDISLILWYNMVSNMKRRENRADFGRGVL